MTAATDVNLPVDTLYKRVEDCTQFTAAANTPLTDPHIFSSAFRVIHKTGMYTDNCKAWKKRLAIEKHEHS